MRIFKTILVLMIGAQMAQAGDELFKPIQPIDDAVRNALVWKNKGLAGKLSDYSQYAMILAPFAIQLDKDKVGMRLGAVAGAHLSVSALTHLSKTSFKRTRPRGNSDASFFSGHTSASFVGAGVICQDEPKLCPIAVSLASATGYLRIASDAHWFSDVAVGAAIGFHGGHYIPALILSF